MTAPDSDLNEVEKWFERTEWGHRIPSQHLLYQRIHIREVWPVREGRKPVRPNYWVDFRLCFLLHFWVQTHRQGEGVDRRNGLMKSCEPGLLIMLIIEFYILCQRHLQNWIKWQKNNKKKCVIYLRKETPQPT